VTGLHQYIRCFSMVLLYVLPLLKSFAMARPTLNMMIPRNTFFFFPKGLFHHGIRTRAAV
jgi:hypothetical protein